MRRNFDLSTGLVAIGAVAVLVSLFLDWYEPAISAWDAFELADWLLAALAVGALVVVGGQAAGAQAPSQRLAWICGIVAFVVVAELLDPPPAAREATREVGAWIALGGAAAMVAGAVLALAQISVTIDVSERRRRSAAVDARGGDEDAAAQPGDAAAGEQPGLWQRPNGGEERRARPSRGGTGDEGAGTGAGGRGTEPPASSGEVPEARGTRGRGAWSASAEPPETGRGGRRTSTPAGAEPPDTARGGARTPPAAGAEPPAPHVDPDRTQPLPPIDRPDDPGAPGRTG